MLTITSLMVESNNNDTTGGGIGMLITIPLVVEFEC